MLADHECIHVWEHSLECWQRQDNLLAFSKHDKLLSGLAGNLSTKTERGQVSKESYSFGRFGSNSVLNSCATNSGVGSISQGFVSEAKSCDTLTFSIGNISEAQSIGKRQELIRDDDSEINESYTVEAFDPSSLEFRNNSLLNESEFVYGKGFVSKLLNKFKKLATQHCERKSSSTNEFQKSNSCQEKPCDLYSETKDQDKKLSAGSSLLKGNTVLTGIASIMENLATPSKKRNSTFYVAKNSTNSAGGGSTNLLKIGIEKERNTGKTVADHDIGEFPKRDSVLHIRKEFEKVVKSKGSYAQSDSVGGRLREILVNNNVEEFDGISTTKDRFQGFNCTALQSQSVQSADEFESGGKLKMSYDSVQQEIKPAAARFEAEQHSDLAVTNSAQKPDSKTVRPGSLLLQPASNTRGPLAKPEYLSLNKFNDIKTYTCSKKRPKMSVDELDKRLEHNLPVTNIDDVMDDTSGNEEELQGQEFSKEFVCEFVGGGVKINRSVLKVSKSSVNKRVSFSLHSTSVFEYPSEPTSRGSVPAETNALESWNHSGNESEHDGDQLNISSKSLQSSPACSGTGKLGLYQARILEHCTLVPCYGTESPSTSSLLMQQQQRYSEMNLRQMVNMPQPLLVNSCSADEPSTLWSDRNSGTELLF